MKKKNNYYSSRISIIKVHTKLMTQAGQRAYNSTAVLVHRINLVNTIQMIAEVKSLKMTLLTKQNDQRTAGPVQTFTEQCSTTTMSTTDTSASND